MEVEKNIKVFNQADICKTVKKTYNVEYKELPSLSKTLDITKNGNYQVTPDCGYTLSKANVNVNVKSETPTPVVTNESTELIADYAYWLKEFGRAGAKVFLSQQTVEGRNYTIESYLFPLEIGKAWSSSQIDNLVTFEFEILLKKGTNHIHALFKNTLKNANLKEHVIESVEIPNCTVILDDTTTNWNGFGNCVENIEIEAQEEGLYKGTLVINNYTSYFENIRLCKPVCAVLCNIEFPVYGNTEDLTTGTYGDFKLNYKNVILYTTNPQSYDWKFKKVDPMLGIKLKYHNTFIYKNDVSNFYRSKLKDRIATIDPHIEYKPLTIHIADGAYDEFNDGWLNSVFQNYNELNIEMLCTVTKSYPYYDTEKDKYIKKKIGKRHEYIKNWNKVLEHLYEANDVLNYISGKIGFPNLRNENTPSDNTFYIKIRISALTNSFKKWYYYKIPCFYNKEDFTIENRNGIILEKIEYSSEEHF